MKYLKTLISVIVVFSLCLPMCAGDEALNQTAITEYYYSLQSGDVPVISDIAKPSLNISGKSMVLMEASTGTVLYEENKDVKLPPASVTKVMTLLLIMEAIDGGQISEDDSVTASEHAASMGGTQIYLEVGETMTVRELLKAVAVPSANDATVALAEYVAGSEEEFVRQMNERAKELGMNNTNFTNCTGLFDDDNHYTTAYDLAVATRELLTHRKILAYTTIWMDSLRNGAFGLANTNKLLRTYSGMNGMKTGYTQLALHCLSGTAERNGMTLIAVVLGSPTSQERFNAVAKMLDYGFSTFSVINETAEISEPLTVNKGKSTNVELAADDSLNMVVLKGKEKTLEVTYDIKETVDAPVYEGDTVGSVTYRIDGEVIKVCPITAAESVERANAFDYFGRIINDLLFKS